MNIYILINIFFTSQFSKRRETDFLHIKPTSLLKTEVLIGGKKMDKIKKTFERIYEKEGVSTLVALRDLMAEYFAEEKYIQICKMFAIIYSEQNSINVDRILARLSDRRVQRSVSEEVLAELYDVIEHAEDDLYKMSA